MRIKCDSIIKEANILFGLEKCARLHSGIAKEKGITRSLTEKESHLIHIKSKVLDKVSGRKYKVRE